MLLLMMIIFKKKNFNTVLAVTSFTVRTILASLVSRTKSNDKLGNDQIISMTRCLVRQHCDQYHARLLGTL